LVLFAGFQASSIGAGAANAASITGIASRYYFTERQLTFTGQI
jgi:hypothetical protein